MDEFRTALLEALYANLKDEHQVAVDPATFEKFRQYESPQRHRTFHGKTYERPATNEEVIDALLPTITHWMTSGKFAQELRKALAEQTKQITKEVQEHDSETFGAKIKTKRREEGLSLRDLSDLIGVSPMVLSRTERGGMPHVRHYKTIRDWLNKNDDDFVNPEITSAPMSEDDRYWMNQAASTVTKKADEKGGRPDWVTSEEEKPVPPWAKDASKRAAEPPSTVSSTVESGYELLKDTSNFYEEDEDPEYIKGLLEEARRVGQTGKTMPPMEPDPDLILNFEEAPRCPYGAKGCSCRGDADLYYCPTGGENEHPVHGGFDVCCVHPELHEPPREGK